MPEPSGSRSPQRKGQSNSFFFCQVWDESVASHDWCCKEMLTNLTVRALLIALNPFFLSKKIVLLGLLVAFLSQRTVSVSKGSLIFLDDVLKCNCSLTSFQLWILYQWSLRKTLVSAMCFQAFSAQTAKLKITACNICKIGFRRKFIIALAATACRRCLKHP